MDASTLGFLVIGLLGVLAGLLAGLGIGVHMATSMLRGSFAHFFAPAADQSQQMPVQPCSHGGYRAPVPAYQGCYPGSDARPYDLSDEFDR